MSRILVVDDKEMMRDSVAATLARKGHNVVAASTGQAALQRLGQRSFDAIITDLQMPGMDGVEATRRIKERLPLVQLLFLTIHARDIESALEAGADGYLLKDSGRQELVRAVRRLGRRG